MERMNNRKLATERQISYANAISDTLGLKLSFAKGDSYYKVNRFITPESVNHLGEIFSENLKILCLWRYVFLQCFHPIVKKYLESYNPKTLAVIRFLAHFHLLGSRIQVTENEEKYKNKGSEKLASIRQIDYANAISDYCNIGISFDENSTYIEVADFISQNKDEYMRMRWRESICEHEGVESSIDVPTESMLFICDNLFKKHGLYAFVGNDDVILYIGKSVDLSSRIPTSYRERKDYAKVNKIMYYTDSNMANVNILEILLIAEYNPVLNTESKTEDIPTKFHSGIDILNDFKEIPHFCDYNRAEV